MTARALLYCAGGGIGDSLVASVVARALRQKFDRVDALTLPGHRETLERVPDLDAVLIDDGGDERALAESLRERSYEACVVTWATPRTARIPQRAGIPIRVGQARRLYSFRFTHRVVVRSEKGDVTSHWSDILLDYARALGCDTDDDRYRFVPTPQDDADAQSVTLSLSKGAQDHGFVLLNPCNAIASRRGIWPVEGWAKLAVALRDRLDVMVAVSGSAADGPIVDAIISAAYLNNSAGPARSAVLSERSESKGQGDKGGIVSIAGKLGIGAFGALAKKARGFVGITTGSMHVAAAVGCPTVGIFPFQSDFPDRWAPLGPHTSIVRPSYPCHRGDTKETCSDYACVGALDVEGILAAAGALIPSCA